MLSFVRASLLPLTVLAIHSGCGGDDPGSAAQSAQAPNEPSDAPATEHDASTVDVTKPDASVVDASSSGDADAGANDQLAFDTFVGTDQGALVTTDSLRVVLGAGGWFCGGTGGLPSSIT